MLIVGAERNRQVLDLGGAQVVDAQLFCVEIIVVFVVEIDLLSHHVVLDLRGPQVVDAQLISFCFVLLLSPSSLSLFCH